MMDVSMIHGVEAITGPAAPGGPGGPMFLAKWWSLLRGKRHLGQPLLVTPIRQGLPASAMSAANRVGG
jgi:hypothetical protein